MTNSFFENVSPKKFHFRDTLFLIIIEVDIKIKSFFKILKLCILGNNLFVAF